MSYPGDWFFTAPADNTDFTVVIPGDIFFQPGESSGIPDYTPYREPFPTETPAAPPRDIKWVGILLALAVLVLVTEAS